MTKLIKTVAVAGFVLVMILVGIYFGNKPTSYLLYYEEVRFSKMMLDLVVTRNFNKFSENAIGSYATDKHRFKTFSDTLNNYKFKYKSFDYAGHSKEENEYIVCFKFDNGIQDRNVCVTLLKKGKLYVRSYQME